MNQINQLNDKLAECNFQPNIYGDNKIYINAYEKTPKGQKKKFGIFIQLNYPDLEVEEDGYLFENCSLRVFCNQEFDRAEKMKRAKQVKLKVWSDLYKHDIVDTPPPDKWDDITLTEDAV